MLSQYLQTINIISMNFLIYPITINTKFFFRINACKGTFQFIFIYISRLGMLLDGGIRFILT